MKSVFADSQFWIAILNPRDSWHASAQSVHARIGPVRIVTTDEVLGETLAGLSQGGPLLRQTAVKFVRGLVANPNVKVFEQTRASFLNAVDRFAKRSDKT